ncbi:MAG: Hsp20/alpha crystallin family protein [candidate division Zixibacteria bacterium]|nr:Hsp20/alpha crystallin family protein [candidate division Zixibacteria bacterium]
MMAITRWRPLREMVSVQDEMSKLFSACGGFGKGMPMRWMEEGDEMWAPNVDMAETKDEIVLTAELPGFKKEDIKLSVEDHSITLSGEKKSKYEEEEKKGNYYRLERRFGSFTRSFALPTPVEADRVKAVYKDGILKVTLPKSEEAKKKEIPINVS